MYCGKPGLFQAGIHQEMSMESLINLPSDIKDLPDYSIFDIAALTIQFSDKGKDAQPDTHPVTIWLTTYKNINLWIA
ncbi:hypothetical protein DI53_3134 [Sphingobacterium deserti]|uniref:Uncharacterized protein n=2 Tax=Sphingobacterium deserti TaxID=1229276 RepID=A0A0B8T6S6_9SPHI|nr:hypothetical protein DI53_3134 [Sphingobacterium deserti]